MWNDEDGRPRRPVTEPEILPPERVGQRRPASEQVWVRQRVFVAPPGPLGVALGLLVLAAAAALGLVLFLGFFLVALPLAGAMVLAFVVAALLRGPRRP